MKAAILTLALAIFMLGASATYVKATGGFTCSGTANGNGMEKGWTVYRINGSCG